MAQTEAPRPTPAPDAPSGSDVPSGSGGPSRAPGDHTGRWRYVFLAIAIVASVFPFYWMFVIGSTSSAEVFRIPPRFVPGANFVENTANAIDTVPFFRALWNSFVVSTAITVSVVFFSSLAGFAFAKLRFRGRNALFFLVVATMLIPQHLGMIPLYMIMLELDWLNQLRAVIVPGMVTAFGVFWMRQYIGSAVPDELLEAGTVDGCSKFKLYWHIILPTVRPAAMTLGVLTFMQAWNDFMWPLVILRAEDSYTIQLALRNLIDNYFQDYGMIMAGAFVGTLPVIVLFFLLGRRLVDNLLEGAVKG